MKIPKLTARQYAILNVLSPSAWQTVLDAETEDEIEDLCSWHLGEDLRKRLKWTQSTANWFQNITRLDKAGLVKGRYVRQDIAGGKVCRAREYSLTIKGRKAIDEFNEFCDYFGRKIHLIHGSGVSWTSAIE